VAYITRYGTLHGQIPQTGGRIFWVAPAAQYTVVGNTYAASDNNDGLSPERALLTLAQAITNATANVGDVIVLLPGAHSWATSVALNKAGLTIWGLPGGAGNPLYKRVSITTTATADQIINVTAADVEIAHLSVIPITAAAGIDFSAAANNLYIHDCHFDLQTPAVNIATLGIDALGAAGKVAIERCYFESDGAQGVGIDMTATVDSLVQDCIFVNSAGTWAAAISTGAATDRCVIRRNYFQCTGTAMTTGIDGTGASLAQGVLISDNRFGSLVTVPIDGFDATEAEISENYDFGVGATDGGVLVVAIT
jgi:hypothetical protein